MENKESNILISKKEWDETDRADKINPTDTGQRQTKTGEREMYRFPVKKAL